MLSMNVRILQIIPRRYYAAVPENPKPPSWNKRILKYRTVEQWLRYKGPGYRLHPEKAMYKLLFRDHSKKQGIFKMPPVGAPSISLELAIKSTNNYRTAVSKRVLVFNKILMKEITEILSTSEMGFKLWKHDIQFTDVKISANFMNVNVYWIPKGTDEDKIIQKLFDEVAHPLRSELIKLKVVGLVPIIHFVKDKYYAFIAEVDRRLQIADYGEDHVRLFDPCTHVSKDLQLQISLPDELKAKIINLEETEPLGEEEEMLPPMNMNVLGFQYEKIHSHVSEGIKKVRILDTIAKEEEFLLGISGIKETQFDVEAQSLQSWDKKAFKNFLRNEKKKQKLLHKNSYKEHGELFEIMKENEKILENMNLLKEDNEQLLTDFVINAFPDTYEDDYENDEITALKQ